MNADLRDIGPSAEVDADPTVVAAAEHEAAAAQFNKVSTKFDEDTPEFREAEERILLAGERLAKAPVTSFAGAAIKARKLGDAEKIKEETHGFSFHEFRTLLAFLDRNTGGPAVPTLSDLEKTASETRTKLQEEKADPEQKGYSCIIRSLEIMVAYLDRRVSEGATSDPTIAALDAYFVAVRRYNDFDEEDSPEFKEAHEQWNKCQDWLAKVPITSLVGAAAYALFLEYETVSVTEEEDFDALCIKHLRAELDKTVATRKAPAKPDPVAELARQLRAVKDEQIRMDNEGWHQREDEEAKQTIDGLFAKEGELRDRISNTQAATAVGAIAQIMLANRIVCDLKDGDYHEEVEREMLERGQRLLYLATATLEGETGINRVTLGGEDFMPERLNPVRQETKADA